MCDDKCHFKGAPSGRKPKEKKSEKKNLDKEVSQRKQNRSHFVKDK